MRSGDLANVVVHGIYVLSCVVLIMAGIWSWKRKEGPRRERLRRAAAERLGAAFQDGAIVMEVGGRGARVDFVEAGVERPPCTCVSVDLRGLSPGALRVVPRDAPGTLRLFGILLVPGSKPNAAEFDGSYESHATPPSLLESLLWGPRREWVIQTFRSLERIAEPALEISRERLLLRVGRDLEDERSIRQLVTVAQVLFEHIADTAPAGVAWMEAGAVPGARCGVCMTEMAASVACARCRAPHHRECWEFTGLCSTFACGSKLWA